MIGVLEFDEMNVLAIMAGALELGGYVVAAEFDRYIDVSETKDELLPRLSDRELHGIRLAIVLRNLRRRAAKKLDHRVVA